MDTRDSIMMTSAPPRPSDSFRWWLIVSAVIVTAAALFSASREKPPVVFALGFGLVTGIALRFAAASFAVPVNRRVVCITVLLVAAGFGLCFGVAYRRAALEWNRHLEETPSSPIAAAILKNHPETAAVDDRYTIRQYLSRHVANWPSPWPVVVFGAEWIGCAITAALCVGILQSRERQRPVDEATSASPVADASGSVSEAMP